MLSAAYVPTRKDGIPSQDYLLRGLNPDFLHTSEHASEQQTAELARLERGDDKIDMT
jgi:hypothetical protein